MAAGGGERACDSDYEGNALTLHTVKEEPSEKKIKDTRSDNCPRSHTKPSVPGAVPGWHGLSKWIRHQPTEAGSSWDMEE